jgi:ParB family chromosome partitioning protein
MTAAATDTKAWPAELAIERLYPDPRQPRKEIDQAGLEQLAASIRVHGVLEALIVTEQPRTDGKVGYTIVAGERRWRAAKIVGLKTVPATVRSLTPAQAAEIQIVENLQREDLTALELAAGYAAYLKATGKSQAELARAVGKDEGSISHMLALLSLPKRAHKLLEKGVIDYAHGRQLARLVGHPEQLDETLDQVEQGEVRTERELKAEVEFQLQDIRNADARLKEAAKQKQEAAAARTKQKVDKKAQERARKERAAAAKHAAKEAAARAAELALTAEIPKVIAANAAGIVKQVLAVRSKLRLPDDVAAQIAACYEPGETWHKEATGYLHELVPAIASKLPGRWRTKSVSLYGGQHDALNAAARLSWIALAGWVDCRSGKLDAELEAEAKRRLAAAAKAVKPLPVRKGGGK